MSTTLEFSDLSFVLVKLLQEPIYREDETQWETLRAQTHRERAVHFFNQLGQELVIDDAEGYAFIRQINVDGLERVPRLTQRRPLTYQATLLLVCLREEFCRFDTSAPDATRLVKSRSDLHKLVLAFLPETTNQVRDVAKIDTAIQRLVELGFLQKLNNDLDEFEVKRIVKAKLGPTELQAIKERLQAYANDDSDGD